MIFQEKYFAWDIGQYVYCNDLLSPVCDVKNIEINHSFLLKPFSFFFLINFYFYFHQIYKHWILNPKKNLFLQENDQKTNKQTKKLL